MNLSNLIYLVYIFFAIFVFWGCKKDEINLSEKDTYLQRMNLLRGIFALDIIIGHVAGQNMIALMPFEKFSIVSVAGFFFLSGFGLSNSFNNKKKYLTKIPEKIRYLIYVTVLLYIIKITFQLFSGVQLGYVSNNILHLVEKYFKTTNWYIWELILLYIFFYIIYFMLPKKTIRVVALFAASFLIGLIMIANGMIVAWYYSILGFPFGILFSEYFDVCMQFIHHWYGKVTILFFFVAGCIGYIFGKNNEVLSFITRNMFCISCITIIILLIGYYKIGNTMINHFTLLSLEIYLYQSLWLDITINMKSNYVIRMLIVVGGTYITALIIHPINRQLKRLSEKSTQIWRYRK